jgi:uncharacterized DUF497 family protein
LDVKPNRSYYQIVDVEFDPTKDAKNRRDHGISLERAADLDMSVALYQIDDREDYGEVRYRAISFLDGKLYSLPFTLRGDVVRAISLRKASKQEQRDYA